MASCIHPTKKSTYPGGMRRSLKANNKNRISVDQYRAPETSPKFHRSSQESRTVHGYGYWLEDVCRTVCVTQLVRTNTCSRGYGHRDDTHTGTLLASLQHSLFPLRPCVSPSREVSTLAVRLQALWSVPPRGKPHRGRVAPAGETDGASRAHPPAENEIFSRLEEQVSRSASHIC